MHEAVAKTRAFLCAVQALHLDVKHAKKIAARL